MKMVSLEARLYTATDQRSTLRPHYATLNLTSPGTAASCSICSSSAVVLVVGGGGSGVVVAVVVVTTLRQGFCTLQA